MLQVQFGGEQSCEQQRRVALDRMPCVGCDLDANPRLAAPEFRHIAVVDHRGEATSHQQVRARDGGDVLPQVADRERVGITEVPSVVVPLPGTVVEPMCVVEDASTQ